MTTHIIQPIKIDYFNDFPLTLEGAESIHVYEICQQFSALGNEVRLFSPAITTILNGSFRLVPIWTPRMLKSVFYQLFLGPKVILYWLRDKPDAIYVRVTPIMLLPVLLAKVWRVPIFAEINGTIHPELAKANTKLGKIILFLHISDIVEIITYRSARNIFTVTDTLKKYLVETFHVTAAKVIVIENGVDSEKLKPTPTKRKRNQVVVGYVGGLMWWQGLEYLIDALAQLTITVPNVQLVIVGDGPERFKLEQRVRGVNLENRIIFKGKVTHDEVNTVINSFDICIAYYVKARDGLNSPFKVYEYLSCGKPVIVSNIKGIGDKFRTVSKVVPAEDARALAKAIDSLVTDESARRILGEKARLYILDGHTWKDTADKLLNAIRLQVNKKSNND